MFSLARQLFQQETLLVFNKAKYLEILETDPPQEVWGISEPGKYEIILIIIEDKVVNLK